MSNQKPEQNQIQICDNFAGGKIKDKKLEVGH